ncbi:hypothetical protein VKT23_000089 [Stygiomarasmius scandens]|uniref:Uncharacterized protein n=1 Tax=Marasmiellus scandens TaxID=2682957 RepID=A0ABR1K510_9AGAR
MDDVDELIDEEMEVVESHHGGEVKDMSVKKPNQVTGPIFIDSDEDSGDEYEPDEEKDKAEVKRAKAKAKKVAIRSNITAARIVQPQLPVKELSTKRKGSDTAAEHTAKRSKADDMGGLDKNWRSVYGQKNVSSTSLASSAAGTSSNDDLAATGEFDDDRSLEITNAAQREKGGPAPSTLGASQYISL